MKWFSRAILRGTGLILTLGLLLSIWGGYYSIKLYQNLKTDIEELLPTSARSVLNLDEVSRRLQSIDNLAILVLSEHPEESKRFVTDLAERLKQGPPELVASVEYKIDRELQFFKERRTLYMDLSDLVKIRDYIRHRIDYEKELYNPLNIFLEREIPEPKLNFFELQHKYEGKVSNYSRFPGGYYATPDGKNRVILVNVPAGMGIGRVKELKAFSDRMIRELNPSSYASDIQIKYTGGVQNTLEEQEALVADLELSTIIVTVLVAVAMWIFFRAFRGTAALLISLFMGTFWTFGVSYFAVGYLNANSAFLGSIIIGNGINFGVIYLARYMEERRAGRDHARALLSSIVQTAPATGTAALAAGLSYGSLMLTGFRGFRQFGVIGLIGMVLCWISAYTMLPALLTLFDRLPGSTPYSKKAKPKSRVAEAVARFVSARPRAIWLFSFVATLISIGTFTRFNSNILEADLTKLRNKESMEHGSGYLSKYVDEIFQRYLSPIVVLPQDREHAREIAERLKEKKAKEGPNSLIVSVQTLDDFVPKDQEAKIRTLHEIQQLLPPRILRKLGPEEQAKVRELLSPEAFKPLKESDLPELVRSKFTEKDGSIGKLVVVEPPLSDEIRQRENLFHFVDTIREVADSVSPGTAVAGTLPITSDMLESIAHDGPRATLFAFLAVVVLIIFLFRNVKTISLVLFSLILGMIWLAGLILGFHLKINFLNFIALPITFGIGVDYGVNIFQRYREEKSQGILKVIRNTGGAVGLCSFTTVVGYGSLLIAQNQAFVSFGLLAVLGELTCVFAAIFSLPAYLLLQNRNKA